MALCAHCGFDKSQHYRDSDRCPNQEGFRLKSKFLEVGASTPAVDKNGRNVLQGDEILLEGGWEKIERLDGVMADGTFGVKPGDQGSRGFRRDVRECTTGPSKVTLKAEDPPKAGKATLFLSEGSEYVWLEAVCSCGAKETKEGVLFDGKFVPRVPPQPLEGSLLLAAIRAWNVQRGAPDAEGRERPVFFDAPCEGPKLERERRQRQEVAAMRAAGLHVVLRRWDGKGWTVDPEDEKAEAAWNARCATGGRDEKLDAAYKSGALYRMFSKGPGWVPHADTDRTPIVFVTGTEREALDKNGRRVTAADEILLGTNSPGWHEIKSLYRGPGESFWMVEVPTAKASSTDEGWRVVSSYETRRRPSVSEPLDKNGRKVAPGDEICLMHGWYRVDSLEENNGAWQAFVSSPSMQGLWQLSSRETRPAKDAIDRGWAEGEKEALERELEAARLALASAYDTCADECGAQADALHEMANGEAVGPLVEGILLGVTAMRNLTAHFRAKSFRDGERKRRAKILEHAEQRGFNIAIRLARKAVTERPRRDDADLFDAIDNLKMPSRS